MGSRPLETLAAAGYIAKNRTISSLRYPNVVSLPNNCEVLVTYAAGTIDRDYARYTELVLDVGLAIRRIKTLGYKPKLGKYKYVSDFTGLLARVDELYAATQKPVPVTFDTETLGLYPYVEGAFICSLQFTVEAGTAEVIRFKTRDDEKARLIVNGDLWTQLHTLLNDPRIVIRGANLKYDLIWVWVRAAINCTNFKFDTMLVGSLLDENRGNSLNLHTKWYAPELGGYDDGFNKKYDKSRMDLVPDADFLDYAGGDSDACYRVAEAQKSELLKDEKLTKFYIHILHPAARAYEHVERTGLLIDIPYYLDLENEIKGEMRRLEKEAVPVIGGRLVAKHGGVKFTNPSLIKDFMFSQSGLDLKPKMLTAKSKEPSTAQDHLDMFKNNPKAAPFIALLKEWNSAAKTLSTYVAKRDSDGLIVGGFLSHIRPDKRFHPTYFLFNGGDDGEEGGTNTGRLSVKNPAVQTIPKHTIWAKRLRRAFIAPPGCVILSEDYTQGELKIAACLANELAMIKAYRAGIDLHAVTAASLSGYTLHAFMALKESDPDLFEALRFLGKAGNFGLIYGMQANGFMNYAATTYGVIMTLSESSERRELFFNTYPGLLTWHDNSKAFARKHKYIRSPLGRVRHLPLITSPDSEFSSKAERQSINAPVQGTLSDMSLWATSIMHRNGWFDESPVIAMIHDQLLSYAPEDNWEACAKRNKEVMENLPFEQVGWKPQLKFTVDTEVGSNLGEMKKVKI